MKSRGLLYLLRRKAQILAYRITTPEFVSKIYFKYTLHYKMNLKNPRSFNEKLQWLKLYAWPKNQTVIQCADKYAVRNYMKDRNLGEYLNEIIDSWTDAKDIDWDSLPNQFVLKCNHGCGYNIICKSKEKLDIAKTIVLLDKWMNEDFGEYNAEPHYSKIKRRIICEKYLGDNVINYNFYCFNGKAIFFSRAGGLGEGTDEYLTYYNIDGTVADFKNRSYPVKEETLSPILAQMVNLAEYISKSFCMVRVDLFDISGKIILSELTFTPGGAIIPIEPVEKDFELGSILDISEVMGR